eukprot:1964060-Ditylum_brightwellii.AAC.1
MDRPEGKVIDLYFLRVENGATGNRMDGSIVRLAAVLAVTVASVAAFVTDVETVSFIFPPASPHAVAAVIVKVVE